jgi:CubicO group peptidase (beta-lactamase class C family)
VAPCQLRVQDVEYDHAPISIPAPRAPMSPRTALIAFIDSVAMAPIVAGQVSGIGIAVVRGNDTLIVKGYGKANLELDVPMAPNAIFEIGSITKQFTGVAIMQLVEQGKLSLDDEITKYVNIDVKGRRVTIRRLLDHTSGMPNYTDFPEFGLLMAHELPRDTLLRLIEKRPFDFEPGERERYNNSAFFLLGLVIEKVSGEPYVDYVQRHLFTPAGMTSASYCSERDVRRGKTSGYEWDAKRKTLVQHSALSHVWPYAAGSLCSSTADIVRWNGVLHRTNTLLKPSTYTQFMTPDTLNSGKRIAYSKGLGQRELFGQRVYAHSGGINGWTTHNMYFPGEQLSVVVFFNTSGLVAPGGVANRIAEAVLGSNPAPK